MNKLEWFATMYVLVGATLWGAMGRFGSDLIQIFGSFGKWIYGSIAVAGCYSIYKYYKMSK